MKSNIWTKLLILGGVILILSTVRDTYNLWKIGDVVVDRQEKVAKLEQEQLKLQAQIQEATSSSYIENYARNKLSWVKPGEKLVILPNDISISSEIKQIEAAKPNWKKWWEVIF